MTKDEFMTNTVSDMMYYNPYLEYTEALQTADCIWDNIWGDDVDVVYEDYEDEL